MKKLYRYITVSLLKACRTRFPAVVSSLFNGKSKKEVSKVREPKANDFNSTSAANDADE